MINNFIIIMIKNNKGNKALFSLQVQLVKIKFKKVYSADKEYQTKKNYYKIIIEKLPYY